MGDPFADPPGIARSCGPDRHSLAPVEAPLDMSRLWTEFTDPADSGQRLRCDLTWLTSSWQCVFGNGCAGIYADRPDDGCCTLGAHFTDDDDVDRVAAAAATLTPQDWQFHALGTATGRRRDWIEREDGARKTRVVQDACIFLNRPDFPGGPGCALHRQAIVAGVPPHTVKPDVCWQLPIRRLYRQVEVQDGSSYLEITITEYDRRGWGPGGHDLDWYCSGNPAAHTGREPVFRSCAAELIELIGEAAYAELVLRAEAHLAVVKAARARGARTLIPLMVHPSTLAAVDRRLTAPVPAKAITAKASTVKSSTSKSSTPKSSTSKSSTSKNGKSTNGG